MRIAEQEQQANGEEEERRRLFPNGSLSQVRTDASRRRYEDDEQSKSWQNL